MLGKEISCSTALLKGEVESQSPSPTRVRNFLLCLHASQSQPAAWKVETPPATSRRPSAPARPLRLLGPAGSPSLRPERLPPGSAAMGSLGGEVAAAGAGAGRRRPRFLCLHGFRTSAEIMRKQVLGKWPADVTARLDLVFADAPFPAEGKSDVEGIFDPPYYEWFQFDKGFMEYRNFDKCLAYIEELMIKDGPFDGLMGFSQGAILSAALPGLQEQGLALTRVPKIKYLIIIGGAKFQSPTVADKAYANKVVCPSLHFIGDNDFLKVHGEKLIESCVEPFVIRHPKGHTVPRLDDKSLQVMLRFLEKIENETSEHSSTDVDEKEVCL